MALIEHVILGKTFLENANLFSSSDYKKNSNIRYKYFKDK